MVGFAAVGECMIELSDNEGDQWRMGFAGDTFNTTWYVRALAASGYPVDYVTAFGNDPFSARQKDFISASGIDTAQSPTIPGARPGLYAITLDGAERSFTYWRSEAAARKLAADADTLRKSLADRTMVYFSGVTLAILPPDDRQTLLQTLREARDKGARIAFDPNLRLGLWENADIARATIRAALRLTDIALPTFPDEQTLFGDASPEASAARIARLGATEIVVKNGADPAVVRTGETTSQSPAVEAVAVDTTGAGDSFNGAYLVARLEGVSPEMAAARAHRIAAAVVGVHGALAPMADMRTVWETTTPS
jgi:2-dehydro-3-deoxygluconokinase